MRAFGCALVLLLLASPAAAAPLHDAQVGDPIANLTQGLDPVPAKVVDACGTQFLLMAFYRPGNEQNSSSAQALIAQDGHIAVLVTFDEDDPSQAVSFYVGDKNGKITFKAPVEQVDPHKICQSL